MADVERISPGHRPWRRRPDRERRRPGEDETGEQRKPETPPADTDGGNGSDDGHIDIYV